jgi:protein PhnA
MCASEYVYEQDGLYICPECFHEWEIGFETDNETLEQEAQILDANGTPLTNGDTVIIVKDLPVKGAPKAIKAGQKVKNIRLNFNSDHNIDCKIEGFGAMALKSEFVRKV